ncbi:unnamed protein product [Pipistrellus nathusii]|uniref:Uncharacterized protein n=1 Tax=Pipistrellus nathusii TaxID=59473 RepID=A0ABN9ZBE7_PIPNA
MALLLSLLTALVLLSSGPAGALGCDPPQDHVLLSRENLVLLSQMSTISPLFCLKDRQHFRFPRAAVDGSQAQKAQALSVLHQMLQQISDLVSTENASVPWNTTLVDQLRTGLHRQLEALDTCWAGDGRGGTCPGHTGPRPGLEEVLPGHPCLPEGEAIQ